MNRAATAITLAILIVYPAVVTASEPIPYVFDVDMTVSEVARGHEPQTSLMQPAASRSYLAAVIAVSGEVELRPGLSLRTLMDTGELRRGSTLEPPTSDALTSSGVNTRRWFSSGAFLRELVVSASGTIGSVGIGRRYLTLVDGLIYEDYGTGAAATLNLAESTQLEAVVVAVGHTFTDLQRPSPLLALRLRHELDLFQAFELTGALFIDRDNLMRDEFDSLVAERIIVNRQPAVAQVSLSNLFLIDRPSSATVGYLGVSGNLLPADGLSIRGALVGSLGTAQVVGVNGDLNLELVGWAATLDASYGVTPQTGIGLTLLGMSGDTPPALGSSQTQRYSGLIGVAPYWAWTGLFFSGGLNQGLYHGRAAAAGIDGRGVAGMVGRGEWRGDAFSATMKLAFLWSLAPAPAAPLGGSGTFYGVETDLIGEWRITKALGLAVEGDVLQPGSFFPGGSTAYRATAQVRVHVGS